MTPTPTPANPSAHATGHDLAAARPTTTVVGSGKGSYVIGLTVTAIAAFAIVSATTSVGGGAVRWVAPLALIVAGLLALLRRR